MGAKIGKLTLLGGLRDTKLELRGGLGAPKEASREAKRALRAEWGTLGLEQRV